MTCGSVHYTYQQQMKSCGKATCTRCRPGSPGHGPYWYAYWHEDGRLHSRYVGKQAPAGYQAVLEPQEPGTAVVGNRDHLPALRVQTLGSFAVWRGDERVPVDTWGPRMRGLFALLLESVERPRTREVLAETLAPDLEPGAAARVLRDALFRLRRALGHAAYVPSIGNRLQIDPAPASAQRGAWWDAQTFSAAAAVALAGHNLAKQRDALSHYGGEYLPGELLLAVETRRADLQAQHQNLLLHGARTAAAQAETSEAEAWLHDVLSHDPAQEQAAQTLMVLLAQASRRVEALHVYHELVGALDRELGISPDPQTRRLAAQLTAQTQQTTAAMLPPREQVDVRSNLPHSGTTFVGRLAARAEIATLLRDQRLITLCGTGGIGKTRLANQVGHDVLESFADGVWQVEFAGVPVSAECNDRGLAHIAPALIQTLGIEQRPDQALTSILEAFLQRRHLLLILDNCEHVRAPAAALAHWLLEHCPNVRVLITSRMPLSLAEELVWQVPPLSLPEAGSALTSLAETEAVQFFVMRARAVHSGFRLEAATADAVVEICRRLDGIPLALELAATRVRLLEVGELAARLDDRFRFLTGNNPVALPRHQTLRATLDWSFALLTEAEQVLVRRLAIFVGGWTLAAAETVCGISPLATTRIIDLLAALVQHSLVLVESTGQTGESRYHMLETIREYCLLQLAAASEESALAAAHRHWCLTLASEAEAHLRDERQRHWLDLLDREHGNIQAALAWTCAEPDADPVREGLGLAAAIWQFWYMRSHLGEGRSWFDRIFAAFPTDPTPLWAKAFNAAGGLAIHDADLPQAKAFLKASLHTARQAGDRRGAARALTNLAVAYHSEAAYAEAEQWYVECLAVFRELNDRPNEATVIQNLGELAVDRLDYAQARTLYQQALAQWHEVGNSYQVSDILAALAQIAWRCGELDRAAVLAEESEGIARQIANHRCISRNLVTKARIAKARGDLMTAADLLYASLELQRRDLDLSNLADVLHELAGLVACLIQSNGHATVGATADLRPLTLEAQAVAEADILWAARLLGAAGGIRTASGGRVQGDLVTYQADANTLRQSIGPTAFAGAWRSGAALSPEAAIALADEGSLLRDDTAGAAP